MNGWLGFGARGEHPGVLLVDIRPGVGERVEDARCLSFADGTFQGIEFHHVIEHLTHEDAAIALRELHRVLQPGGLLELSCPDLEECARTLLQGDLRVLMNIYSPHPEPAQLHRWGYTKSTIRPMLETAGFHSLEFLTPTEHHEIRVRGVRA